MVSIFIVLPAPADDSAKMRRDQCFGWDKFGKLYFIKSTVQRLGL